MPSLGTTGAIGDTTIGATGVPMITRAVIQNYKSIAYCDVLLGPLTFLVGRNASGKTNFLDALQFLSDALRQPLEEAVRIHGTIGTIGRVNGSGFQALGMRVEFRLPHGQVGSYAFEIGESRSGRPWILQKEECRVWTPDAQVPAAFFRVVDGTVTASEPIMPASLPNHLYLINASGLAAFRDVYFTLAGMRVYDLDSTAIAQSASAGEEQAMSADGANSSGVLLRLSNNHPTVTTRIHEYMRDIVPEITEVGTVRFGGPYYLTFRQRHETGEVQFGPNQVSDGTLRALGILLTLFQQARGDPRILTLIGMEEPETGLHRAALAVLRSAFQDASETTQLLITTHSTDLLDAENVAAEWVQVVVAEHGTTHIGPLSAATHSIVRDHLSTAGELLRSSPLEPATEHKSRMLRALFDD